MASSRPGPRFLTASSFDQELMGEFTTTARESRLTNDAPQRFIELHLKAIGEVVREKSNSASNHMRKLRDESGTLTAIRSLAGFSMMRC